MILFTEKSEIFAYLCKLFKFMKVKLAIVILNWNGKSFLERFLPSLLAQTPDYAQVIIADNASSDDSVEFLKNNYPYIRLILNDKNYGFAGGYNNALAQVDADYYCLLNSDIEVAPNWVGPIMDVLDADSTIAAAQPKLINFADRTKFEYAGAAGGFIDKYGYPFCRGRIFESLESDEGQYDNAIDIFWASGAALFVRSDVYHALGGLDNDFFAHMEEIDLCWRIKNQGHRIVCEPRSTVYHVGGGTLPKNNAFKTFLNFRNNHFLLLKNLPKRRLLPTFFMRLILDNVAAFVFLLQGHSKDFTAVYKAHLAVIKQFGKIKAKRKGQRFDAYQEVCRSPILFQYHFKRKRRFDGKSFH